MTIIYGVLDLSMSPLQNCVFRLYCTSTILRFVLKWLQQGLVDRAQCVSASTQCPVSSVVASLWYLQCVCVCVCSVLYQVEVTSSSCSVCVCEPHPPLGAACKKELWVASGQYCFKMVAVACGPASKQAARSSSKEEGRTRQ